MSELFAKQALENRPLAERLRPAVIDDVIGQEHLIGPGKPFREALLKDRLTSCIFWGPPGCGKTTLARLIATQTKRAFVAFSAVLAGVKEIREIVETAKHRLKTTGQQTVLFVDEVHRFNKSQQDAFLPHVEDGTLIFIGATTENPSFEVNAALLSRCRVLVLKALDESELLKLAQRSFTNLGRAGDLPGENILQALAQWAGGDARRLLNGVEVIDASHAGAWSGLTVVRLGEILQTATLSYDQKGEMHYDTISAFIKSLRGSDPDAALHYLARMLESGEDPRFVARRMIIFASEDVGNADPRGLQIALAAADAFERIGMPEGWIPLAHAVTYLASVPKSNASYMAYKAAKRDVLEERNPPIPVHLRNAPTKLMKDLGYGKEYRYPHDDPGHVNDQSYMPEGWETRVYYDASHNGFEEKIKAHLEHLRALRRKG